MGGKCQICGYGNCLEALDFHHIHPEEKTFNFNKGQTKSWDVNIEELKKCVLLCSNCHREVHAGIYTKPLQSSFDESKANEISEIITKLKTKQIRYCPTCNSIISQKAKHCSTCSSQINRKVEKRPTKEELKDLIRNKSFLEIGRMFNVSDNAIRKWCASYGLPRYKNEVQNYSDNEWNKI